MYLRLLWTGRGGVNRKDRTLLITMFAWLAVAHAQLCTSVQNTEHVSFVLWIDQILLLADVAQLMGMGETLIVHL